MLMKPVRSDAAVPALFAAVPVSWPIVAGILVAAGIGTAVYWNSLSDTEKMILLDNVRTKLVEAKLTLKEKMAIEGGVAAYNLGEYIRSAIVNGKNFFSRDVTDTVCDAAQEGGYTGGGVRVPTSVAAVSVAVGSDMYQLDRLMIGSEWADTVVCPSGWSVDAYNTCMEIVSDLTVGSYWCTTVVGMNLHLYTSSLTLGNLGDYTAKSLGQIGRTNIKTAAVTDPVESWHYEFTSGGIVKTQGDDHTIYYDNAPAIGSSYGSAGNVGLYGYDSVGAPSGEIGQVSKNQDGTWEYPRQLEDIDDYGASLPVSIDRQAVGIDGVASAWDGTKAYPDSIALPDALDDTDTDIGVGTQAGALAGTVTIPDTIADEPDLVGSFDQFLVPKWIKTRFPWCIPFDIGDAIARLKDAGATAPRWYLDFPLFGYHCVVDIDLSVFNDIMVYVRYGELIIFGISLIWLTREMIRW